MTDSSARVSAVLFAKDARRVATFYHEVFGFAARAADEFHALLDCGGFSLMIQKIPEHMARDIVVSNPPERRESGSVRLDYPVKDVAGARRRAQQYGGRIDDEPPAWAAGDDSWFLGFDPEGNVFCVKVCR
jgi:predicted enzyme related to lactoylglutathione lyase